VFNKKPNVAGNDYVLKKVQAPLRLHLLVL